MTALNPQPPRTSHVAGNDMTLVRAPGPRDGRVARLRACGVGAFVGLAACGAGGKGAEGPNAQSPERQAVAEYDLARELFYKDQPRAALDHARRSVELDPDNAKSLYFASVVHLSFCSGPQGFGTPDCQLDVAEDYARRAVRADEAFRDAKNLLGQVLILRKKYEDAIAVLEPLTRDPAYQETHLAWGNLGWAQVQLGKVDDGIASLRNAVTQPRFCVGHYRLGIAYEKKADWASAEASFSEALSVDSPDCKQLQDALEARARVRVKLGKLADARADFQACKDLYAESATGKQCAAMLGAQAPAPSSPPQ
jgi:Tfp pilus assembly protein PilF